MTIRARLLLLTLLAAALPALLGLARFLQDRERALHDDSARLALVVQRRAESIDEKIQGTAQLHFGLSRTPNLAAGDRDTCSAFLSDVLAANPQYTGILTILPDGTLFCDSLRSGRSLDLRDRAYFQSALAARNEVVLEPVFGRLTGIAVLQIAYPVRSENGALQFVLLASLNLQKVMEFNPFAMPGARLMLVDASGTLLAASRSNAKESPNPVGSSIAGTELFRMMQSRSGRTSSEIAGADGEIDVWSFADVPGLRKAGLHVAAGVPKRALVAAANQRLGQDFALIGVGGALIFLAVWLVAEVSIRRQIERITRMAGQLAAGDLTARIAAPLPRGELGSLMSILNRTAEALQKQRADIEELNERLRQSQRMEAIGQLTGGVAHDFNNLLTVVMGNAELLADACADNPDQHLLAEMIGTAALRGAELTQRLLAFSRKQALDPKVVDLNHLVADMDPMLRRTLGEHIEIELIRGAGLWLALIDQGQLENALLNLCVNARDAMPRGGRLTVETANVRLDADYADQHADVTPGQYVMLAVSDTGDGITPANLKRIFEPFFTTKDKGKGTGLGLAMVYGFVKQSHGHIAVYSEPGQGTTLKLYVPRAIGALAPSGQPLGDGEVVGGSETILLVEDDDAVRRYAREQLRSFGYQVIDVSDGPSALKVIERGDPLDLLFTDVVMPGGMNGRALVDAAHLLRPGLPVLYTSGYTENAIVHHGRLDPGARLLTKPYRRSELDRAVRAALESAARPIDGQGSDR